MINVVAELLDAQTSKVAPPKQTPINKTVGNSRKQSTEQQIATIEVSSVSKCALQYIFHDILNKYFKSYRRSMKKSFVLIDDSFSMG